MRTPMKKAHVEGYDESIVWAPFDAGGVVGDQGGSGDGVDQLFWVFECLDQLVEDGTCFLV